MRTTAGERLLCRWNCSRVASTHQHSRGPWQGRREVRLPAAPLLLHVAQHAPRLCCRCYAFFHEAMPGEPLVVLHTALTHSVAGCMDQLLPPAAHEARLLHVAAQARHHAPLPSDRTWEDQPAATGQQPFDGGQRYGVQPAAQQAGGQAAGQGGGEAEGASGGPTVAVFYSISATQKGLGGVDLGNFLIKQVGGNSSEGARWTEDVVWRANCHHITSCSCNQPC